MGELVEMLHNEENGLTTDRLSKDSISTSTVLMCLRALS